jgi:hypothetical protein
MYRKGKKGISYVCAVRRKFRTVGDVFEAGIQALIDFLESYETIPLATLQRDYIEANHLPEKEVLVGLDWLIREGYVVHYDNGTLLLNPKSSPRTDKEGEWRKVKSESIIPLEKIETAVEKLSDGTLFLNPEFTPYGDGTDESTEGESGTIIPLGKIETAVEKRSDGTLSIAQTTTLAAADDNLDIISPLAGGSDFGDGIKNEVDELENKTTNGEDQDILNH